MTIPRDYMDSLADGGPDFPRFDSTLTFGTSPDFRPIPRFGPYPKGTWHRLARNQMLIEVAHVSPEKAWLGLTSKDRFSRPIESVRRADHVIVIRLHNGGGDYLAGNGYTEVYAYDDHNRVAYCRRGATNTVPHCEAYLWYKGLLLKLLVGWFEPKDFENAISPELTALNTWTYKGRKEFRRGGGR